MIHFTLVVIIVHQGAAPPPVQQPIVQDETTPDDPVLIYVTCEVCGWRGGYDTMPSAKMGLGAHRGWCKRGHGKRSNLFGKPS